MISSELLSIASSNRAQSIVEELGGDRVHVLLSVRPLAFLLTSIWQEGIKAGDTEPLDVWMREMACGPYAHRERLFSPWIMADFADAVRRWRDVVGSNRLSVLMVEPNLPAKLLHDFEDLLSLPQGFLGSEGEKPENRSLTYHEAEFLRQINARLWGDEPPQLNYSAFPWWVIQKFLRRVPGAHEERLSVPAEILEKMAILAEEMRDRIVESGVNIIGDINSLMKMPPSRPEGSICGSDLSTINMEIILTMIDAILDPLNLIGDINGLMKRPKEIICGSNQTTISMEDAVLIIKSINRQRAIIQQVEAVLIAVYNSRSWRWTAPLRWIAGRLGVIRNQLRRLR